MYIESGHLDVHPLAYMLFPLRDLQWQENVCKSFGISLFSALNQQFLIIDVLKAPFGEVCLTQEYSSCAKCFGQSKKLYYFKGSFSTSIMSASTSQPGTNSQGSHKISTITVRFLRLFSIKA